MKIFSMTSGDLEVNSYFLIGEDNQAILIDSGEDYELIRETEKQLNIKIKYLFLTHGHFDHAGNAKKFQDNGVKVYISKIDAKKLLNKENLSLSMGKNFDYFTCENTFSDNEEFNLCGIKLKVLLTAGHTDGSATFVVGNNLFTGDTLFKLSCGRTDFPTGNKSELKKSLQRLYDLDGEYNVYPGHGEFSTLSFERKYNKAIDYD